MPGTGRYGTVASKLRKKSVLLAKSFPNDPQNTGELTHERLVTIANQSLLPRVQFGDPILMPRVALDFSDSPEVLDAPTSAKQPNRGLPMTPFSPNVVSPGADPGAVGDVVAVNLDPTKAADPGLTTAQVRPSAVIGINGLVSPATTGQQIGALRLDASRETLQAGKHNVT